MSAVPSPLLCRFTPSIFLPLSHPALAGSMPGARHSAWTACVCICVCVCVCGKVQKAPLYEILYILKQQHKIPDSQICRRALHQRISWCMFWLALPQLYVAEQLILAWKSTVCPRYEAIQDQIHSGEASWQVRWVGWLVCFVDFL